DLPAETIHTPDRAKDQRERAGGIGGQRRRSEKQQGRESDERSTARYGVDHPRRSRSRCQSDDFRSRHAGRESGGTDVQLKPTGEGPKFRRGWPRCFLFEISLISIAHWSYPIASDHPSLTSPPKTVRKLGTAFQL